MRLGVILGVRLGVKLGLPFAEAWPLAVAGADAEAAEERLGRGVIVARKAGGSFAGASIGSTGSGSG